MKKIIKGIIWIIITIFSHLYSYGNQIKFKNFKNTLYSYWVRNSFKNCGRSIHIQSPIYLKGGKYITIGEGFSAAERLRMECWDSYNGIMYKPNLVIGNNVNMNFNVHIGCINEVIIGNNVLFGSNILITDHQHGHVDKRDFGIAPTKRKLNSTGPVNIEDNVWIGENVVILPNVTIGKSCIIGANSVVTRSFPKNTVIAGVPAKIIKHLNSNS